MAENEISILSKKLNDFVANLNQNVNEAILSVEKELVDLNRSQMLSSKGNDDKALIHSRTGKPTLSKAYAKKTGKTYPNIFLDGTYQNELNIHPAYSLGTYSITSKSRLEPYLPINYKNLQGIAPTNQQTAQGYTTEAITKLLKQKTGL